MSNAYQLEAMINVLERKGLLTKAEVLEELKEGEGDVGNRGLIDKFPQDTISQFLVARNNVSTHSKFENLPLVKIVS